MGTRLNALSSKLSASSSARAITYLSRPSTPLRPGPCIAKPLRGAIARMWAKNWRIRSVFSKWLWFGNTKAQPHFPPLSRLQADRQAWSYSDRSGTRRIGSIKKKKKICPKISLKVTDILDTPCIQWPSLKNICSGEHQLWVLFLEASINNNVLRVERNLIKFGKPEDCSLLRTQAGEEKRRSSRRQCPKLSPRAESIRNRSPRGTALLQGTWIQTLRIWWSTRDKHKEIRLGSP